jgi:hypothetical protein
VIAITSVEAATAHTQSRIEEGAAMIDLTNNGIQSLLYAVLDDISDTARATYRARMSARLLGRALALRMGLPVWQCQRVAKAWKQERRSVCSRGSTARNICEPPPPERNEAVSTEPSGPPRVDKVGGSLGRLKARKLNPAMAGFSYTFIRPRVRSRNRARRAQ